MEENESKKPERFGLRTCTRAKLPKGLSYPLQLSDLAPVFEVVPDERFPTLHYSLPMFPSGGAYLLKDKGPYVLIETRYWRLSNLISDARYVSKPWKSDTAWKLYVHPVRSQLRAKAHELTLARLPLVRDWFAQPRPETWLVKDHRLRLGFDPSQQLLYVADDE